MSYVKFSEIPVEGLENVYILPSARLSNNGKITTINLPDFLDAQSIFAVLKYVNNTWSIKGNSEVDDGVLVFGEMSRDGNNIAISVGKDADINSGVFRYDSVEDQWVQIGSDISDNLFPSLSSDGLTLSCLGNVDLSCSVFRYSDSSWNIIGQFNQDSFLQKQLSNDGNRIIIFVENGDDSGIIKVYEYDGENWNQLGSDLSTNINYAQFYIASSQMACISGDGTTVALTGVDDECYVSIYKYVGDEWQQIGDNIMLGVIEKESLSLSLSNNGNKIVIGLPDFTDEASSQGRIEIHDYSGGDWNLINAFNGDPIGFNYFGSSVSISGDGKVVSVVNGIAGEGFGNFKASFYRLQNSNKKKKKKRYFFNNMTGCKKLCTI